MVFLQQDAPVTALIRLPVIQRSKMGVVGITHFDSGRLNVNPTLMRKAEKQLSIASQVQQSGGLSGERRGAGSCQVQTLARKQIRRKFPSAMPCVNLRAGAL